MYVVIIGGGQIGSYMADLLKRNKLDLYGRPFKKK